MKKPKGFIHLCCCELTYQCDMFLDCVRMLLHSTFWYFVDTWLRFVVLYLISINKLISLKAFHIQTFTDCTSFVMNVWLVIPIDQSGCDQYLGLLDYDKL